MFNLLLILELLLTTGVNFIYGSKLGSSYES